MGYLSFHKRQPYTHTLDFVFFFLIVWLHKFTLSHINLLYRMFYE